MRFLGSEEPVDGFSVELRDDLVVLSLLSRYGTGEVYSLPLEDAHAIALAILLITEEK